MSWVKDVIDTTRDLASDTIALRKIKRSLLTQCQLNGKLLSEFYKNRKGMAELRKQQIASRLDVNELEAALNCGVPFGLISRKKVTEKKLEKYRWNAKSLEGNDLETLLEKVYLMAAYLQKDFDNPDINLNNRLVNLYKYNSMLIELLR
ncbi:MAG: hypothetical protein H6603_05240 [Flavobacteriales bacterium]|nr:hypothetical protein [Flavobacteriales bacterium]MCB9204364.1 hypothetical protein [Flavobacteriales bacterium]